MTNYNTRSTAYPSYAMMVLGEFKDFFYAGGNNSDEQALGFVQDFLNEPEITDEIAEWFSQWNTENPDEPVTLDALVMAAFEIECESIQNE